MDAIETVIATKRIARWSKKWQAEIVQITPAEREVLMTLVALLDARPVESQ